MDGQQSHGRAFLHSKDLNTTQSTALPRNCNTARASGEGSARVPQVHSVKPSSNKCWATVKWAPFDASGKIQMHFIKLHYYYYSYHCFSHIFIIYAFLFLCFVFVLFCSEKLWKAMESYGKKGMQNTRQNTKQITSPFHGKHQNRSFLNSLQHFQLFFLFFSVSVVWLFVNFVALERIIAIKSSVKRFLPEWSRIFLGIILVSKCRRTTCGFIPIGVWCHSFRMASRCYIEQYSILIEERWWRYRR